MASRKDLLKAHKFTADRLVKALVTRDPDQLDQPLRRSSMGIFASIMIAVVVMAGFGVVGLLKPGNNTTWKQSETLVVIDSEAGQVYWYRNPTLYPMTNITSAKLAAATDDGAPAEVVSLKSKSLQGVERGPVLGIPEAPRQLPRTEDLGLYPVQVCATAPDAARDNQRHTTLRFGEGAEATADRSVPVFLVDGQGNEYLVADGVAHRVPKQDKAEQSALSVMLRYPRFTGAYGLLSTIPVGSELTPERILDGVDDLGDDAGRTVGKAAKVGDLVQAADGSSTYVLLSGGLAEIRPLEFKVLENAGHPVSEVPSGEIALNMGPQEASPAAGDLPTDLPPEPTEPGMVEGPLCATWSDEGEAPSLSIDITPPEYTLNDGDEPDPRQAVVVSSLPGKGALLANTLTTGDPQTGILLVDGHRYPIADRVALSALGYGEVEMSRTSTAIINLIPVGLPDGAPLSTDRAGCGESGCPT
ncbi:MAG TPA: type VII secretion protein EccB [Candidatus Avipropionibacterium avicola]|uniref:Type VII secretion protein EccB n=1 Tax=Candidatus Avipropionibacterium avicola TaxID=2840701 RepID=A0A9D1GVC5_9ACTN|nr:type VII secretion protein EccB [Candidatus Avipropionibacterium avicola]